MAGASCTFRPDAWDVEGHPSNLYVDFLKKVGGDRPFTNYIYALYRQDGTADAMDNAGYVKTRDKYGEHSANAVFEFFNVADMRSEAGVSVDTLAKSIGVMDSNDAYIDFDAETAYKKAKDFNDASKGGKVAYVQQHGDKFNVILENKDSKTFLHKAEVELQMKKWDTVDNAFRNNGIDLNSIAKKNPIQINPLRTEHFLDYLKSLSEVSSPIYLSKRDISMVLEIGKASPKIQALLGRGWGTVEETAERAFDVLHNPTSYAQDLVSSVREAINEGRKINDALVENLKKELKDVVEPSFVMLSKEFDIKDTLKELDDKYDIDANIIVLQDREIHKLSEGAAHAMVTLQRQMHKLKTEKRGTNAQLKEMSDTIKAIANEIEGKRYYAGMLTFMSKALQYAQRITNELESIPTTGSMGEFIMNRASALATAKNFNDGYAYIVRSIANLDSIVIDENISDADKKTLKEKAKLVLEELSKQENKMKRLREDTMIDTCVQVFGDNVIEGQSVADIVKMAEADCSIMDYLYSVGRQSNPLLSAMGTVIRDAQLERDQIVSGYRLRISRATDKLYKAGHNTEFMYVKDKKGFYRIASDIDFDAFKKAKAKEYARLKAHKIYGFALRDAMDAWLEANTEIDGKYSTVSRVPRRDKYSKSEDFQAGWTNAQKEYYDEVMAIKGEMEVLLPSYAQNLYLPPQRRAGWLDIVKKGIDGKMTLKQVARNLLDRMNPIKVRANEDEYGMLADGTNYVETHGAFDGSVLKQVPVYYTRMLKDQNDLLLDFSAGLQSLVQTAVNYDTISKIKDLVDLMGDYIKNLPPVAKKNGATNAEVVDTQVLHVVSKLRDKAKAFGLSDLVDGFIDKHIYGVEVTTNSTGWRILQSLINYTSLNQLAPNLKGALSNFIVGEHQMLIEAVAGSIGNLTKNADVMYSLDDYAAANALVFGSKLSMGNLMDHLTNNTNSLGHLLAERFDPLQELAGEQGGKRYYTSTFRQIVGGFDVMGMYSGGEAAIHYVNMYASLLHEKVLNKDGKKVSLYAAFEKVNKKDGNAELAIKDGYTRLDGSAIDEAYLNSIKDRIRYINQKTHGSMNKEDKGLIHRHMAGRAVMNFRQWMVEHYSRRYRGRHWDASQRKFVEGYFNTVGKWLQSVVSDYVGFINDANCHWDQMDDAQRENIYRAAAEVTLLTALIIISGIVGDPSKYKGEYWKRMWIYQLRRLILDEKASTYGIPKEGVTILDSPIASINTINGILYPINGLLQGDASKTIQSGRYKGWNKYGRNLLKNVPFYKQIDQTLHIADEDYVFSIFNQ